MLKRWKFFFALFNSNDIVSAATPKCSLCVLVRHRGGQLDPIGSADTVQTVCFRNLDIRLVENPIVYNISPAS